MLPESLYAFQGHSGDHGHGHDKDHGNEDDRGAGNNDRDGNGHGKGHGKHYFRDEDGQNLARYYDGPRDLPPGLRKKYYRNGTLPPGWQNRFRPMPPVLIQQLPPIPDGYQRGYYDGYAVVLNPRTRILYDVVDVVGALTGH